MSEPITVRTDQLRAGDRVWHPFDCVPFTVAHTPRPETGLHFEGEPGLRVTGTNSRGETVHVDVAPAYKWHRAPITNVEDAVAALGALPVPQGPEPLVLTDAQIEALAAAGNRVVNDARHEDLCMCDAWPETCLSSGNFSMGDWDMSGLEAALPAVLALWEQMRGGELQRLRTRVAELEAERHSTNESLDTAIQELRLLNTQRGDVAQLIERERGEGEECVDIDALESALGLGSDGEVAPKCRCDEPDADPYACEAEDCTAEFSELNPFGGGSGPVEGHDAKVSKTCGCGWKTSVWHVNDGSAEEELHGHVVRVHGGVYPGGESRG